MEQEPTPQEKARPNIVPAAGAVLITPSLVDDTEEQTSSGLMIARAKPRQSCEHQTDPHRGVVMRLGEGVDYDGLHVGNRHGKGRP